MFAKCTLELWFHWQKASVRALLLPFCFIGSCNYRHKSLYIWFFGISWLTNWWFVLGVIVISFDWKSRQSTDWRKLSNPKVWVDAAEQVFSPLPFKGQLPTKNIKWKTKNLRYTHGIPVYIIERVRPLSLRRGIYWFCNKTTKTVNLMFYVRRWSFPLGQLVAVLSLSPHTTGLKYLSVSLLGTLGMANHLAVSIQTHENLISFYFWCLYFLSRFERNCHKDAVLIALSNSVRPLINSILSNSKHNINRESM